MQAHIYEGCSSHNMIYLLFKLLFFFFNDTATTEIYTLSLHDALPICIVNGLLVALAPPAIMIGVVRLVRATQAVTLEAVLDRKSTRLNSSHSQISYAVFCLKKKKKCISHTSNITSE